jgi:hypothetical protein
MSDQKSYLKQIDDWVFYQVIVTKANETRALLDGTTEPVRQIIDSTDIVYAVWQDATLPPLGVGVHVIKGKAFLEEIIASGQSRPCSLNAIPVQSAEHAIATELVFGDGKTIEPLH